jgi:sugar phosphate isomerase/epimerase
MNKIGVADYGMNVWDGGAFDPEQRWADLRRIGYDGVERLTAATEAEAVRQAAQMRRMGMDYATVLAPTPALSMQWTAAFGREYVWTGVSARNFDDFCRQAEIQARACMRWGVRAALHNHMGTPVETQDQLETFLALCPDCGLILDTAHLAAMGGDPAAIVRAYPQRLMALHLKDWLLSDPGAEEWYNRGRFCRLGEGNIGLDNHAVLAALIEVGYEGWIFVEQDTHLHDPLDDLAESRRYIQEAGF